MPGELVQTDDWKVEAHVLEDGRLGKLHIVSGSSDMTLCATLAQWERFAEIVVNNCLLMRKLQGLPPPQPLGHRSLQ